METSVNSKVEVMTYCKGTAMEEEGALPANETHFSKNVLNFAALLCHDVNFHSWHAISF